MFPGLSSRSITPGEVQLVITTHGHPDHFGQGNFFPNARHFFGSYEYADDNFIRTELHVNESMRITTNVELWNTPGHTAQDITVMVSNVPCCGTVAVVGDLFYDEADALNQTSEWFNDAWDPIVGKRNRYKVICQADFIVPGHGKLFRVTTAMKDSANCRRLLAPSFEMSTTPQPYTFPKFTFTPADRNTFTYSTTTQSPDPKLNDDGEIFLKDLFDSC
ncbi:hypothetical protein Aduo_019857 [Ancylostoma duodenale]